MDSLHHVELLCLESVRDLGTVSDGCNRDFYAAEGLIEQHEGAWRLTAAGARRLEALTQEWTTYTGVRRA